HHDRDVRGDDAALHPVFEVRADHLDLGAESGGPPVAGVVPVGRARARAGRNARMSAVYALYSDGDSAQTAVDALRGSGVGAADITIITDEALEDYEFGAIDKHSRLWYVASAGGFAGFLFATWLTRMTELAWPLPTGNMPIVAWWPNLNIMFELTMLG